MAYTAQKIHEMAISIIDEMSDNGTVDANKTKEYSARAPKLLDMWQKELAESGSLYSVQEYNCTDEDTFYLWTKETLPTGMRSIKDTLFIDADYQISTVEHKQFGKTDLYVYYTKLGTLRVLYIPTPTEITALSATLQIDDFVATTGAYYLAEHYAMADQNTDLAGMCKSKFNELKNALGSRLPFSAVDMIDVYGGG